VLRQRHARESDIVREVLVGLQGRNNMVLSAHYTPDGRWQDVQVTPASPTLEEPIR
jgi:hypothetical protein